MRETPYAKRCMPIHHVLSTTSHCVTNRLWIYRKQRGYSQKMVATLLGHKTAVHVSDYERGRCLPSLETALKLEIILGVPVAFLYPTPYRALKEEIHARRQMLQSHHHV